MGASISVSSIRSGLAVPGDDVAGISTASWPLGGGGAAFRAVLEMELVRLATLDLLEALALLETLDLLKILGLLIVLAAGALAAAAPLVVIVIGGEGRDWVRSMRSGLYEGWDE